jgi:uncharacterized protein with GYD domain
LIERAAIEPSAGIDNLKAAPAFVALSQLPLGAGWPAARAASHGFVQPMEDDMPTFILTINWTDQGIRAVKEAPRRSEAAKALAKKVGVDIKQIYLTSGEHDILVVAEAPEGDNVTKFALSIGSLGNVRTNTARAWPEPEWTKLISELP